MADMVDMFCVLLPPGSGDELQGEKRFVSSNSLKRVFLSRTGMKKGIMEMVDLILITKADGELMTEVHRLKTEWSSALRLMRRRSANWNPKVTKTKCAENRNDLFVEGDDGLGSNKHKHREGLVCHERLSTGDEKIRRIAEQTFGSTSQMDVEQCERSSFGRISLRSNDSIGH